MTYLNAVDYSYQINNNGQTYQSQPIADDTIDSIYTSTTNNQEVGDNYAVSANGETCTDGKDDGKIGFFDAVKNIFKGAAKTLVNGVKGMFTDSEGNFSLGKTLLSIGAAAICITFPAVGLAACAIGGVMGAVQVGKGVYNAATAETDAEAKEAWQNIGGGALTVAGSVVGAKASLGAIKATSTAGGNVSALSQLDDGASLAQKAVALGKDAVSSTKNRAGQITDALSAHTPLRTNSRVATNSSSAPTSTEATPGTTTSANTATSGSSRPIRTNRRIFSDSSAPTSTEATTTTTTANTAASGSSRPIRGRSVIARHTSTPGSIAAEASTRTPVGTSTSTWRNVFRTSGNSVAARHTSTPGSIAAEASTRTPVGTSASTWRNLFKTDGNRVISQ